MLFIITDASIWLFCRKKAAFPVAGSAVFFNVYFKAFAWYLCVVYIPTQTQEPLPLTVKGCKRYHWRWSVANVNIDVEGLQTLPLIV